MKKAAIGHFDRWQLLPLPQIGDPSGISHPATVAAE
jgi:hypothetical protein